MIICSTCSCEADRVKCAVNMMQSGYTIKLPCETDHVLHNSKVEGRPKNISTGKDTASTFPRGNIPRWAHNLMNRGSC